MTIGPDRGPTWVVGEDAAGCRLDKFLASPERLGSRARAVSALERRKVYLNAREASVDDASVRVRAGDEVRVWIDRPGSATTPCARGRHARRRGSPGTKDSGSCPPPG